MLGYEGGVSRFHSESRQKGVLMREGVPRERNEVADEALG